MIIKKLTMNNFGVYAGKNVFEFSQERPIVLVGGMNGRGKTTFLEAILLALYGSNSSAYKESDYTSYGKFLRSYVNKYCESQSACIELEFAMNESSMSEYVIRREWDAIGKRTDEEIAVYENGVYSDFLTKNWAMFVENILPSALSRFFFFDGEKIAELAVDDTNEQMKDSVRSMLGIGALDVLKNDLSRVLKRLVKGSAKTGSVDALEGLRQKKDELSDAVKALDVRINALNDEIEKSRADIDELHNQYEVKGGNVIEKRQALMQQRADLNAEIEQNQNELVDCASGELSLVLVRELIEDIKLQAEDEQNSQILQQTVGTLEKLLKTYSKEHPDAFAANAAFVDFVRKTTRKDSGSVIYQISDHAVFQLNSLLNGVLDQNAKRTKELLTKKKTLKKKLDEVESYLTLDINEKSLATLFAQIRKEEAQLVQKEVELGALQQERASTNAALTTATTEFNRAVENYLQNAELFDDEERMTRYTNMALRMAEEYTKALQRRKADLLGATITECYEKLANKKNLIQKIVMDPETLDLAYLDDKNGEVSKRALSAGEKQLMVIAILWALAICSKKKLPVIIDTPLARLDSMHRTALVKTYFPNASAQTIILSTDSEIDKGYYDLMKHAVGDEFTLSYSEETKSTTILKGYFQNNDY